MKRVVALLSLTLAPLTSPAFGQVTLSGMTMWLSDATGAWNQSQFWNTLGWPTDNNSVSNVYFFTGAIGAPSFNTSANSDASLNPNVSLGVGSHVFGFVGNNSPASDAGTYVGINLYFNSDLANNRISALVPKDGTTAFATIGAGTTTFGETGHLGPGVAGAGALSYTTGGYTITLSSLSVLPRGSSSDAATYFSWGTTGNPGVGDLNDSPDTIGSLTLTVAAVPEPSTVAALLGLAALGLALWQRRPGRRP